MKYSISLNQGSEILGSGKTLTANEVVETVDAAALAREIHHLNPLIPEQVAEAVLANFSQAAAQLMAMGYAITLKNGNDAVIRIYPDIHIKGGNINLARAKQLDPTVTELTLDNAGDLVSKAGLTVRAKAECESKFSELLTKQQFSLERKEVREVAYVKKGGAGVAGGSGKPDSGNGSTGGSAEELG